MIKQALILDYKNDELHFVLGELYLQLQQIDQARSSFETAVNLDPTKEKYLEKLFWTYRRSSVTDSMLRNAQNTLNKLIELASNKPEYYIYSGNLYLEAKKHMQATYRYQKAIEVAPEDTWGYIRLAKCYEKMGEYRIAKELYKLVVGIENNWLNYEELADFYYRRNNFEDAIKNYKLALKMKPEQLNLRVKLGKAHWAVTNEEKALEIWGKILKDRSLKLNDYIKLGQLFTEYDLGNLAVATYKQGIKEFSGSIDSWTKKLVAKLHGNLARLYKEHHNYELAMNEYESSLKLHSYSWVYKELGVLKLKDGELDTAMELWKKARKEDASDLEVVYDLAITQIIIEEFDEARDNLRYIQRYQHKPSLKSLSPNKQLY
jgi:tetratricopeptide (TPR) repeat protein